MAGAPSDDHYELLGIDAGADDAEIRRAYRQLAMRWHPDRAGPDTTFVFQRLSAAYAVLSDPVARAAYDRKRGLRARGPGTRGPGTRATSAASATPPPTSRRHPPSPPATSATGVTSEPPTPIRPRAPGVLLRRLSSPLNVLLTCGIARYAEDHVIELFLEADEVAEGGMVTISMRVPVRCPDCAGDPAGSCARCGTSRSVEDLFSAWLAVPPGVAEGTLLEPSVLLPGMLHPVSFRVRRAGSH